MQKMGGPFALSIFPHCRLLKSTSVFGPRGDDGCLWERRFHLEDNEGPSRMTMSQREGGWGSGGPGWAGSCGGSHLTEKLVWGGGGGRRREGELWRQAEELGGHPVGRRKS